MPLLQTIRLRAMAPNGSGLQPLPPDIESRRIQLEALFHSVGAHARIMDGWLFGYMGADAAIGMVPVLGDVVSGMTTLWLLGKARQAKMPWSDQLMMLGLGAADVAVGLMPGVGDVVDVFFRAHEWNAQRVQPHVLEHLQQIESARGVVPDAAALEPLRDQLFRGGRTRAGVRTRLAATMAVFAALLAYCTHEAQLRHKRIVACEASGQWFCAWRN